MNLLKNTLFTLALFCFTTTPLLAASLDELKKGLADQGGDLKFNADSSSGDKMRLPTGVDIPATDLKKFLEKSAQDSDVSTQDKLPVTKAKIKLKLEAGDGFALASWVTSGAESSAGQLRYVIMYGTESGRLDKRQDVGVNTSYKLRELKNNQIYYVQVQGYAKDR